MYSKAEVYTGVGGLKFSSYAVSPWVSVRVRYAGDGVRPIVV